MVYLLTTVNGIITTSGPIINKKSSVTIFIYAIFRSRSNKVNVILEICVFLGSLESKDSFKPISDFIRKPDMQNCGQVIGY